MLQHKHKPIDPRCWTIPRTHKPSDFWVPIVKQPQPPHCHHATSEAASQARHVALPLWHHSIALSQRCGALSHMTGQNLRGSVPEMAKNGRFPKLWHPLCFFGLIKTSYWGTPMTFRKSPGARAQKGGPPRWWSTPKCKRWHLSPWAERGTRGTGRFQWLARYKLVEHVRKPTMKGVI